MAAVPVETLTPARVKGCCVSVAPALPAADAAELAALFKAVADPTRVQMLHMLKAGTDPICVCDFTAAFELGQPTVSHHLAKLRDPGLITSFKRGVWTFHDLRSDLKLGAAIRLSAHPVIASRGAAGVRPKADDRLFMCVIM